MSVNMNSERSSAVKIGEWTFAAYMAVEHAFCDYFSKTTNWAPEYLFSCYQCRDGFASKVSTSCLYLSYHVALGHTYLSYHMACTWVITWRVPELSHGAYLSYHVARTWVITWRVPELSHGAYLSYHVARTWVITWRITELLHGSGPHIPELSHGSGPHISWFWKSLLQTKLN
jgi:hypothetical protein